MLTRTSPVVRRFLVLASTPFRSPATRAALALATCAGLAAAQGASERLTLGPGGLEPDGDSLVASMSADERFVAFRSAASNLVPGDTNGVIDVFVLDRQSGAVQLVSAGLGGAPANGESLDAQISSGGNAVIFWSRASNLVANDTNGVADIFVRDLSAGTTERVNVTASGAQTTGGVSWISISGDGRLAAFGTDADLATGAPGAMSGLLDLWMRDRQTGAVQQLSIDAAGQELAAARHPRFTPDGRFVAFRAFVNTATGLVGRQIFVRDLTNNTVVLASVDGAGQPSNQEVLNEAAISDDGRFVAFSTFGTNLVGGDTNSHEDVFVRDLVAGTTERISVSSGGAQANADCVVPRISADGRFVTFYSAASNLVPGDTNGTSDAFVHDRLTRATQRVHAPSGLALDGLAFVSAISADGLRLLLVTNASNAGAPGSDTNGFYDVYLRDRASSAPSSYCAAKTDALGCTPSIGSTGTPSATSATPFLITASNVSNQRRGRLYWSLSPSNAPFQGGTACLEAPVRASRVLFSNGSSGVNDCSGSFQVDFNAQIQLAVDPTLVPGTVVYTQFRYADLPGPGGFTVGLSDALVFAIAP